MTPHEESPKVICESCQRKQTEGYCQVCQRALAQGFDRDDMSQGKNVFPATRISFLKYAVYGLAFVNFVLGLIEGLIEANSISMVIYLAISLCLLSMAARTSEFPISVLICSAGLSLLNQLLSPVFGFFEFEDWFFLKLLLILMPAAAILYAVRPRLQMRRSKSTWTRQ
jgi:hypothetical protein